VSELAELFVIFLVLYLFECLAWVPRRTVGFYRWSGRWRARNAFRPNAGWSVAVVVGKPWPPLSPPWLAEPLPFAVDPEGITLTDAEPQRLPWDELGPLVANGNRVWSGDDLLSRHACRQSAASLAEALEQVRTAPPKKREGLLQRFLDARFVADVPTTRQHQYRKSVRALRATANALWLALFGGLGVAVLTHNLLFLLLAAALTLLLWPIHSLVFALTLRRLDWLPRSGWPERSKRLVAMLSPLSGVRAADMLAREAWANVDPLTAAAALLSDERLREFGRPLLVAVAPRGSDGLAWWRTEVRRRMERVLATRGITAASLLAPPERNSERAQTYCPACLAQYESGRDAGTPCPNESCQDVPLRAFDADASQGAESQDRSPR
jgi:hypothetical protein